MYLLLADLLVPMTPDLEVANGVFKWVLCVCP